MAAVISGLLGDWPRRGTARLFDLLGQQPGLAIALDAQRARHDQGVLGRRLVEHALIPEGLRAKLREGPAVEAHVIFGFGRSVSMSSSIAQQVVKCESGIPHFLFVIDGLYLFGKMG